MIVLGINEDHNASAAIVKDGVVLACASEERFTGIKNDVGYPKMAIEYVLHHARVGANDLDKVVYASFVQDPLSIKLKRITRYRIKDYVREMHEYWKPVLLEGRSSNYWDEVQDDARLADPNGVHYDFAFMKQAPREKWDDLFTQERRALACRHLKIPESKVVFVDHHMAHAYYAYFASPIDKSKKTAVVTADGWGDGCNATVSIAHGNGVREVHRTSMCNIARIYRWVTLLSGMKPNEHEYKVMGLAPYAKDYIKEPAYKIFKDTLVVDGIDFKWKEKPRDMYFHFKERFEQEGVRFDGIAGGIQQWVEELVSQWVTNIMSHLDVDQLVMSGGLAMNIKANKVVAELPSVRDFFIAASPADETLCIGAAYVEANKNDVIEPLSNVYFGPAPTAEDVEKVLRENGVADQYDVKRGYTADDIAECLVRGKVLGRCVGRMEFGARALGNRSILCDPSKAENLQKINEKIKFRDFWMPFTPSILKERVGDYLVNGKNIRSPFMTMAFDSTPLGQKDLKAALHPADHTIRPQMLEREVNPEYYDIIKAFEKKTGIGGILNTSFNLHGKPIVLGAADAFYTFLHSGLDGLALPGVLILKRDESINR